MKETAANEVRVLALPAAKHVAYGENFVDTVVCELRFPTVLEFEKSAPEQFAKSLRKDFPLYERVLNTPLIATNPGLSMPGALQHRFKSRDQSWTVTFSSSNVALETSNYLGFEDYFARFTKLLTQVQPTVDSSFFTRVGLRYINSVAFLNGESFRGWLNEPLTAALMDAPYGEVSTYWQEVQGRAETGEFSFRHGLAPAEKGKYVLDFDFSALNVEAADCLQLVTNLHEQCWRMFDWAIGPLARKALSGDRK